MQTPFSGEGNRSTLKVEGVRAAWVCKLSKLTSHSSLPGQSPPTKEKVLGIEIKFIRIETVGAKERLKLEGSVGSLYTVIIEK